MKPRHALAIFSAMIVLLLAGTYSRRGAAARLPSDSTARMAARLAELADGLSPDRNPILNGARADALRLRLDAETDAATRVELQMAYGQELTLAGRTADAIRQLTAARLDAAKFGPDAAPVVRAISGMIALAYLRLGEQENCISGHNVDSCLLPIRGAGVYTKDRAARLAVKEYTALLAEDPGDLAARWLLNVAYMTLGEYPDGVPADLRIPPSVFASEFDVHRFVDVAPGLGLAPVTHAGGVVMDDFDGDGYLDLMTSSWGLREQMHFFRNNGDGTFADRTAAAGLSGETGGLNLVQADYDNDGHLDLLVLRGAWLGMVGEGNHPSSLLHNNGDGTFEDVTERAGLLKYRPTQAAAWADYDGDGWLDLFVGVESTGGGSARCELYRNNGDGTFTDAAAAAGLDVVGFVKAVAWGDYNNDGRPDLYISRFGQPNLLFRNDGPAPAAAGPPSARPSRWAFTDTTPAAGVAEPLNSFAAWFFDYDNDGWADLFVAPFLGFGGQNLRSIVAGYLGQGGGGETPRLYRNAHDGTFADVTRQAHLDKPLVVMGSNFGDVDGDGWPDIYLGTGEPDLATLVPNRMFRNNGGAVFQDVTTSGGFGHLQKGHGIAFGDIDNDGDQDVYAVMGGAYEGDVYQSALFRNPGHDSHWITLLAEGVRSNRSAIGTRVTITVETPAGRREIRTTVSSGGSFGASPLRQTIGLGDARAIRSIEVRWPASGAVQRFEDTAMDGVYVVREGAHSLRARRLARLALGAGAGADTVPHQHR